MTPDLQQEFQALSERARQQLREVPACGGYQNVFSFWIFPSSSPASRCTVHSPLATAVGKKPFASFIIWRSDLDLEKLRAPAGESKDPKEQAPTMQGDVLWLADREIEEIQQRIRGVSVPLYLNQEPMPGADGTSFEFRYDDALFGASLRWWVDSPKEWRPFTDAIMHIVNQLEDRRKAKVPPIGATNGHTTQLAKALTSPAAGPQA